MSGRRVEFLIYKFVSLDNRYDFSRATAWQGDLGGFDWMAEPCRHIPEVNTQMRRWHGRRLNRTSAPGSCGPSCTMESAFSSRLRESAWLTRSLGAVSVEVGFASAIGVASDATVKLGHGQYPPPSPKLLEPSPLVEELLGWVRDLRERRLPMLVVSYLFLTRLEFEYNGRDQAAARLNVSKRILDMLGILSERNDPEERRKVKRWQPALTSAEREWILAALPRLTHHIAEVEAGSMPPQLNMGDSDLPRL
jgi:hypothetical protein